MYIVNGQCFLSGSLDLANSAALYQASINSFPGYAFSGLSLVTETSFLAHYTNGTLSLDIPNVLLSATEHQCALPGQFVWLPPVAFDLLVYAIPGLILTLWLIKLIKRA